ncbi:TetR/AcrR family transcriptional regulator [bacterium]|nr:TetR/AcrR family transcriptional regulator [bacterium]
MRGSKKWSEMDSVRDEIFNNAIRLFAKKGYFSTTIRDVVEKAGVTQPMVYYYFGNKEELFITCIKELYSDFRHKYDEIEKDISFKEFVEKYTRLGEEIFSSNPEKLLLMIHFLYSPEEYPKFPELSEIITRPLKIIIEAVRRAKSRGELAKGVDEYTVALVLFGSMVMTATIIYNAEYFDLKIPITPDKFNKTIKKMLFDSILRKK